VLPLVEDSYVEATTDYVSSNRKHMMLFNTPSAKVYATASSDSELTCWLQSLPHPTQTGAPAAAAQASYVPRSTSTHRNSAAQRAEVVSSTSALTTTIYDIVNLAKARQQSLFTCGAGESGQLGLASKVSSGLATPTLCTSLKSRLAPREISMGLKHSVCVTVNGGVAVSGSNKYGQLGIPGMPETLRPQLLASLRQRKIRYAACGSNHTVVADEFGSVFTWGANSCFQCSLGNSQSAAERGIVSKPCMLPGFGPQSPTKQLCDRVFAGPASSAAVDATGKAWVWGLNDSGQLGVGYKGNGSPSCDQLYDQADMKLDYASISTVQPEFCIERPTQVTPFAGKCVLQVAMALSFTLWRVVSAVTFTRLQRLSQPTEEAGKLESVAASSAPADARAGSNGDGALMPVAPSRQMDKWLREEAVLHISGRPGRGFYVWQDWQRLCGIDTTVPYTDPVFGDELKCTYVACGMSHGCIISRGRVFSIGHGALGLVQESNPSRPLANAPNRFVGQGEAYASIPTGAASSIAEEWFSEEVNEDKHNEEVLRAGWPAGTPHVDSPGLSQVAFHPMLCTTLQLEGIEECACGTMHSIAKSRGGRVFSFGSNLEGQLATGSFVGLVCPAVNTAAKQIVDHRCIAVAAGGSSSAFLAVRGHVVFESSDRRVAKAAALHWWGKVQARLAASQKPRRRLSMFVHEELQGLTIEDLGSSDEPAASSGGGDDSIEAELEVTDSPLVAADGATSALDDMVDRMLDAGGLQIPAQSGASSKWTEHTTEAGLPYFYDSVSGESRWERPPGM